MSVCVFSLLVSVSVLDLCPGVGLCIQSAGVGLLDLCPDVGLRFQSVGVGQRVHSTIQYNTTLLSLCREICFLARHLHKNIQYS